MEALPKIESIAIKAREWAEEKQRQYNFFFTKNLCGMCAKASGYLFEQLKAENIPAKLALTSNHCFVIVENYIVDITATQFSREKVMIKKIEEEDSYWWQQPKVFDSIEECVKYQVAEGWEIHQLAKIV